jgi:hypothetical protein
MKLRNIFVAVTVTLVAIAMAAPAGAQLKCSKAKQNKKTRAIEYSFTGGGGNVQWSIDDLGLPSTHNEPNLPLNFANVDSCQAAGRGRRCVTSTDEDLAATAPSSCKIYLYDAHTDSRCELYISGCQRGVRPLPVNGLHAVDNNYGTVACWDPKTNAEWHTVFDQSSLYGASPVTLADANLHQSIVNGETLDSADKLSLHNNGAFMKLPNLPQLKRLIEHGGGCDALFRGCVPTDPCTLNLFATMWPVDGSCLWSSSTEPSSGDNWIITRTDDLAGGPSYDLEIGTRSPNSTCGAVFVHQGVKGVGLSDRTNIFNSYGE